MDTHKFYELSEEEQSQRKIQEIMSKLHSQESVIMKMLQKYNQSIPNAPVQTPSIKTKNTQNDSPLKNTQRQNNRSRESKIIANLDSHAKKLKKAYGQKNEKNPYALPIIKNRTIEHRNSKVSDTSARSGRNRNLINSSLEKYDKYYDIGNSQEQKREIIRDHLLRNRKNTQKDKNVKKNLSYTNSIELKKKQLIEKLNKPQTNTFRVENIRESQRQRQRISADKELQNILKEEDNQNFIENQLSLRHQIMKPLSVPLVPPQNMDQAYSRSQQLDSDSDSNDEGVTLKFHARELDKLFNEQCKEELNFLFFSKTAQMKEWSVSAMQLFKKHDQQLEKLHKRNQFLKTFDDTFFKGEIYKNTK